jgi:hypothetical protein
MYAETVIDFLRQGPRFGLELGQYSEFGLVRQGLR